MGEVVPPEREEFRRIVKRLAGDNSEFGEDIIKSSIAEQKEVYNLALKASKISGISYTEFLTLSVEELNLLYDGYIDSKIDAINTQLSLDYSLAQLMGIATNSPKDFPKKPSKVSLEDLKPKSPEDIEEHMHDVARSLTSMI